MRFKITVLFLIFLIVSGPCLYAQEELSWIECIRESAKNHPDLIAALQTVKQSQGAKQETKSVLFPQVSADVTAETAKTAGSSKSSNSYSYGVSGTQLIFDGLKTINNVRAASEDINAAKEGFRFTSTTVRFRLRSAFIDLLKAEEMLRITEEIFRIRRENLELITLRYESGLEHKGALLTAEADLAQAKYGSSQTNRSVLVAQRGLIKEMGRKGFLPISVKGDFKVIEQSQEQPDFEKLARNNPSLLQLSAQRRSAEFSLKSAYANFFPEVSANGGANKTGPTWVPKGEQWNLGIGLSLPLFEGGLRTAQVTQARALVNKLQENERSTHDGIILTLQQAWVGLQDALENVSVQRKILVAAEERSKIAQAQYSIGLVTFDNWTIIEDNLVSAKGNYLDAQAAALLAEARWIQAKGETLEYE